MKSRSGGVFILVLALILIACGSETPSAKPTESSATASACPFGDCKLLDDGVVALVDSQTITVEELREYMEAYSWQRDPGEALRAFVNQRMVDQELQAAGYQPPSQEDLLARMSADVNSDVDRRAVFRARGQLIFLAAQLWLIEGRVPKDDQEVADWAKEHGEFSSGETRAWLNWLQERLKDHMIVIDPEKIPPLPVPSP
jgi:hypothetical protein